MKDDICILPDGRALSYRVFGPKEGVPLLVFPGTPGSRYFKFCSEELLKKYNFQLFVLERPGYGESTSLTYRNLRDWPKDVEDFLNGLNFSSVHILGYSGGGPHALACGALLPRKISSLTIVASADPHAESTLYAKLSEASKKLCAIANSDDRELILEKFKKIYTTPKDLLDNLVKSSSPRDAEIFSRSDISQILLENFIGGLKQGSDTTAYELATLLMPWGFQLENIKCPFFFVVWKRRRRRIAYYQ